MWIMRKYSILASRVCWVWGFLMESHSLGQRSTSLIDRIRKTAFAEEAPVIVLSTYCWVSFILAEQLLKYYHC